MNEMYELEQAELKKTKERFRAYLMSEIGDDILKLLHYEFDLSNLVEDNSNKTYFNLGKLEVYNYLKGVKEDKV